MKKITAIMGLLLGSITGFAQTKSDEAIFDGNQLFATVKKFVSLGIHRTGTLTDNNTSAWLGAELKSYGYEVKYLEFPLKQFFLENAAVKTGDNKMVNAFPLWYVNNTNAVGKLVDSRLLKTSDDLKNKIVYLRFHGAGQLAKPVIDQINKLIQAHVNGIVAVTENQSGQIQAINAQKDRTPWPVPIVLVAPKDSAQILSNIQKNISIIVKGSFKQVTGRNVYGKIGNGSQYVVVSTPISGWFTCGGERGPGVATWLALAKWAANEKLPYTFIFTGNSGHELAGIGANAFLEQIAPAPNKTKLWVHLGAGIATLQWRQTAKGLVKLENVDPGRNIIYTASVKPAFETAFKTIPGNKQQVQGKGVGELVYVAAKGYQNYAGAAFSHPYFHVATDDESTTSPQVLNQIAVAFKNFIQTDLSINKK